jgi:hypothetical protein
MGNVFKETLKNKGKRQSNRKTKPTRQSESFLYPVIKNKGSKREYCICKAKLNEKTDKMIECENCGEWYHYKCLDFEMWENKKIDFKCGFFRCNNQKRFLQIDGIVWQNGSCEQYPSKLELSTEKPSTLTKNKCINDEGVVELGKNGDDAYDEDKGSGQDDDSDGGWVTNSGRRIEDGEKHIGSYDSSDNCSVNDVGEIPRRHKSQWNLNLRIIRIVLVMI